MNDFGFKQAISDTCRMMGNRAFMDLMSVDEIYGRSRAIIEPQDVICIRDYMQVEKTGNFEMMS